MLMHRFRGNSEGRPVVNDPGKPSIMEHGSPLRRMVRLPRSFNTNSVLCLLVATLVLYVAHYQHSLQSSVDGHHRDLAGKIDILQTTVDNNNPGLHVMDNSRHMGATPNQNVYLRNDHSTPTVWVMAKSVHHLNHVITVFKTIGYQVIRQAGQFDAIWSYDYPFSSGWKQYIMGMKDHQKINHFPGSGYITNKMSLSTSKLRHLPKAYEIPKDVAALKKAAASNPEKMWVMKSNDHRGIKIKKLTDMDLSASGRLNFVQEFVGNPFLIDGRKFDIGVYVTIASINPLRVYMYDKELLLRFCTEPYHPLDVTNVEKYVIGDKYTPTEQIPSLKDSVVTRQYSLKQTLAVHLKSKGHDPEKLWSQIRACIRDVTLAKENDLKKAMSSYPNPSIFFEMVRFDFVIDDQMQLWLMEVNMSPNLSSNLHPENAIMYEQVVFNTLSLVGVGHITAGPTSRLTQQEQSMRVRTRDVLVPVDECHTKECNGCAKDICMLCGHCVSNAQLKIFKAAFLEHTRRLNFRRVYPIPPNEKVNVDDSNHSLSTANKIMTLWYKAMCNHNHAWCV